jgi:hypothetical protein
MTFAELLRSREWKQIRDCPGRFVLRAEPPGLPLAGLLAPGVAVQRFSSTEARDAVLVARFDDGGIISYERGDGTIVHTLNTEAGFRRKLEQLGIKLD